MRNKAAAIIVLFYACPGVPQGRIKTVACMVRRR